MTVGPIRRLQELAARLRSRPGTYASDEAGESGGAAVRVQVEHLPFRTDVARRIASPTGRFVPCIGGEAKGPLRRHRCAAGGTYWLAPAPRQARWARWKHRIDQVQYMAQVTLGALTIPTAQVRLEGSGRRIEDEQCGGGSMPGIRTSSAAR